MITEGYYYGIENSVADEAAPCHWFILSFRADGYVYHASESTYFDDLTDFLKDVGEFHAKPPLTQEDLDYNIGRYSYTENLLQIRLFNRDNLANKIGMGILELNIFRLEDHGSYLHMFSDFIQSADIYGLGVDTFEIPLDVRLDWRPLI